MLNPIKTFLSPITGKVIAALVIVIIALGAWIYVSNAHYVAEKSTLEVTISKKDVEITNLKGALTRSQKDLKDSIAINEINDSTIQELQGQIVINTKICTAQVTKLKGDISKLNKVHTDLHNYGATHPTSFLNYRIPDEVIDAANGRGK